MILMIPPLTDDKKLIPIKVPSHIIEQFDAIQEEEGFGNRAATFTYLIKFYRNKRQDDLEESLEELDRILSRIDKKKIPSLKKQLGL